MFELEVSKQEALAVRLKNPPCLRGGEVNPEIVIGWVKDKFGEEKVAEIHSALESQILEQRSPSKASGLPWS